MKRIHWMIAALVLTAALCLALAGCGTPEPAETPEPERLPTGLAVEGVSAADYQIVADDVMGWDVDSVARDLALQIELLNGAAPEVVTDEAPEKALEIVVCSGAVNRQIPFDTGEAAYGVWDGKLWIYGPTEAELQFAYKQFYDTYLAGGSVNLTEADRAADLSGEETAVLMSGDTGSKDVAVFIPWWGEDSDFLLTTYYLGVQLADAMGGSCKRYLGKEATLDELSNALSTCRMVFIHTHGGNGTVTLLSDKGITSQDYQDYHVTKSGSGICSVDGQAILNHLNGPVVTDYFSMNSCLGMAAERMEAPLREAGVKAVFGFSQSVTFAYDITYTRFLISGLLQGKTVAEAFPKRTGRLPILSWNGISEQMKHSSLC